MEKDEYIRRCVARYVQFGGMSEGHAKEAAEATWEAFGQHPDETEGPEADADADLACFGY